MCICECVERESVCKVVIDETQLIRRPGVGAVKQCTDTEWLGLSYLFLYECVCVHFLLSCCSRDCLFRGRCLTGREAQELYACVCVCQRKRVMADSTRPLTLLGSTSPPLFLLTLIRGSELHHTHTHTHTPADTYTHFKNDTPTRICTQCASFGSAVSTIEKEKEDVQ